MFARSFAHDAPGQRQLRGALDEGATTKLQQHDDDDDDDGVKLKAVMMLHVQYYEYVSVECHTHTHTQRACQLQNTMVIRLLIGFEVQYVITMVF